MNIKYEKCLINGKDDLGEEFFQMELENFSQFECCPKSLLQYRNSFPSFPLLVTCAYSNERMIAYRILMHISKELIHDMLIVVREEFRNRGIGRTVTLLSNEYAFDSGYQYISEFTMSPSISLKLNCVDREGKQGVVDDETPTMRTILTKLKVILKNERINIGNSHQERYYVLNGNKYMDAFCLIYDMNKLNEVYSSGK